jgi:hypothetical protein
MSITCLLIVSWDVFLWPNTSLVHCWVMQSGMDADRQIGLSRPLQLDSIAGLASISHFGWNLSNKALLQRVSRKPDTRVVERSGFVPQSRLKTC